MGDGAAGAKGQGVMYEIGHADTCWSFFKEVAMMPKAVGAAELDIDERMPFLDATNFGDPWQMDQRSYADAVGDDLPFVNGIASGIGHGEAKVGRSDAIEVRGSGEKFPCLIER